MKYLQNIFLVDLRTFCICTGLFVAMNKAFFEAFLKSIKKVHANS